MRKSPRSRGIPGLGRPDEGFDSKCSNVQPVLFALPHALTQLGWVCVLSCFVNVVCLQQDLVGRYLHPCAVVFINEMRMSLSLIVCALTTKKMFCCRSASPAVRCAYSCTRSCRSLFLCMCVCPMFCRFGCKVLTQDLERYFEETCGRWRAPRAGTVDTSCDGSYHFFGGISSMRVTIE